MLFIEKRETHILVRCYWLKSIFLQEGSIRIGQTSLVGLIERLNSLVCASFPPVISHLPLRLFASKKQSLCRNEGLVLFITYCCVLQFSLLFSSVCCELQSRRKKGHFYWLIPWRTKGVLIVIRRLYFSQGSLAGNSLVTKCCQKYVSLFW